MSHHLLCKNVFMHGSFLAHVNLTLAKFFVKRDDNNFCTVLLYRIDRSTPTWYNYVLCGIRGILEEGGRNEPLTGLNMAISGNIPPSSGLSSSSALVCASALAVSHAHELSLAKDDLAEICARCERHVGTQGGGMDQAISFLATAGK